MKKALLAFLLIALSSGSYAQNNSIQASSTPNSKHDYYTMEGEYLVHYYVDIKKDTVLSEMSLSKVTTITPKAELVNKGKIIFLKEGECVDSKGSICDCSTVKRKLEEITDKSYSKPPIPESPQASSFSGNK